MAHFESLWTVNIVTSKNEHVPIEKTLPFGQWRYHHACSHLRISISFIRSWKGDESKKEEIFLLQHTKVVFVLLHSFLVMKRKIKFYRICKRCLIEEGKSMICRVILKDHNSSVINHHWMCVSLRLLDVNDFIIGLT